MTWGMVGGAAIGVVGSIAGGLIGSSGAKDAAKEQAKAAQIAAQEQRYEFDRQIALQQPWRDAGIGGLNRMNQLLGLGGDPLSADYGKYAKDFQMSDFQQDPGYAFRLSEGLKALDNQAAARGGLISGNALKAASNYGQESASQEYQNAFNRYQTNRSNQLNPLQSLAGIGQSSTNALTNASQNMGSNLSELALQQGNARASGYAGQANAWNNALQGIGNYGMKYAMMNRMYPSGGGGYGGGGGYIPVDPATTGFG